MKNKILAGFLAMVLVGSNLAGCGSKDSSEDGKTKGTTISIECGFSGTQLEEFQKIVNSFTEKTGTKVQIITDGSDYEATMKTKMASNDLPDIWITHGWSVMRYSEYLMPLQDEEWYDKIDESILGAITDEEGKIYVLPITEAVTGFMYNKDVMEKAGVDVTSIRTWEDFGEALGTIKAQLPEVTPLYMSCNKSGVNSYLLENIWPSLWTNEDVKDNQAEALKDGSFDWGKTKEVFEMLADWQESGYFNVDAVTAGATDAQQALGHGECGFLTFTTEYITSALTYNPEANLGVMPVPSSSEDGKSYFGVGEGNGGCFGIYKDTKHEKECKEFLDFMAEPENAKNLAEKVDGGIPALSDTVLETAYVQNAFKEAQEHWEGDLTYDNFFDRVYLPSGMWDVMGNAMTLFFDGNNCRNNINGAVELIETNYKDLMQ